jgi:hypothetical protein
MNSFVKLSTACALLASSLFVTVPLKAIEQPEFEIIDELGDIQIRKYPAQVVARTLITGEFSDAGNEGFRRLAGYIFGGNVGEQKIAMTAPVSLEPDPEMSPESHYWVTFNMPGEYAREELPEPEDQRVIITQVPERYAAVLRYKGNWSEARYREHEWELISQMENVSGWQIKGVPSWARYNPPFTPWFMRTNEVAVEVVSAR